MKPGPRAAAALALTAILLAAIAYTAVQAKRTMQGTARIQPGQPLNYSVWYEDPGTPGATVTLDPSKTSASITVNVKNKALHLYDYDLSGYIVKRINFYKYVSYVSVQMRVLGVNYTGGGAGLAILNIEFDNDGDISTGYYSPGVGAYYLNDTHYYLYAGCSVIMAKYAPFTVNMTLRKVGPNTVELAYYINGIKTRSEYYTLSAIYLYDVQFGRWASGSMYELYVDDIAVVVDGTPMYEDFEDGDDDLFRTPQFGSNVGWSIVYAFSGPILHVYTSAPNGSSVVSWKTVAGATYTGTAPVLVAETFSNAHGVICDSAWGGLLKVENNNVTSASTINLSLTVNNLYRPNLSTIYLFVAIFSGSGASVTLDVNDYYTVQAGTVEVAPGVYYTPPTSTLTLRHRIVVSGP